MAHFAELDKDNNVIRVIVIGNENNIHAGFKSSYPTIAKTDLKAISGKMLVVADTASIAPKSETIPAELKQPIQWEDEAEGIKFLKGLFGQETFWIQTSYNGNRRKNFAGIGMTYDSKRDAFIAPQPFKSWVLNEETCQWEAPIKYPEDGKRYYWNEEKQDWALIEEK